MTLRSAAAASLVVLLAGCSAAGRQEAAPDASARAADPPSQPRPAAVATDRAAMAGLLAADRQLGAALRRALDEDVQSHLVERAAACRARPWRFAAYPRLGLIEAARVVVDFAPAGEAQIERGADADAPFIAAVPVRWRGVERRGTAPLPAEAGEAERSVDAAVPGPGAPADAAHGPVRSAAIAAAEAAADGAVEGVGMLRFRFDAAALRWIPLP